MNSKWAHNTGVYRRFLFVPFAYALVLCIPATLMLLALNLNVAMYALLAIIFLSFFIAPYIPWVRRTIDEHIRSEEQDTKHDEKIALRARMSEPHRRELSSLEKIGANLAERSDTTSLPDDCIGIERLLTLYTKLAIAHRESCNALDAIDIRPEEIIASLEMNGTKDKWVQRRLILLQKRRKTRMWAHIEQDTIRHKLGLISDTIRWMQEECASTGTEKLYEELDFALSNNERDIQTLKDFAALRQPLVRLDVSEEETIDDNELLNKLTAGR